MANTKLQEKLSSHYDNAKSGLGGNSEHLEQITKIAGNRGLSHGERVRRIENWTNYLDEKGSLSDSEKTYIDQALRINQNYVKTTSRTRKIKDVYNVRQNIATLRTGIRTNNLEGNIESNENQLTESVTDPIQINNYQPASRTNHRGTGFLSRAGGTLINTLVAGVILLGSNYITGRISYEKGEKSQQPKIKEQQAAISVAGRPDAEVRQEARQGMVEGARLSSLKEQIEEISSNYGGLKNDYEALKKDNGNLTEKLTNAGRPDEEVRQEAIQSTTEKLTAEYKGKTDELTTKYEGIMDSVEKQAQAKVNTLLNIHKIDLNQQKYLEQELTNAGRPDAEVRQEAIQSTTEKLTAEYEGKTEKLTTKYERIIDGVEGKAQAQVDELLKQQENQRNGLEQKLAYAGRPDEEVRKEAIQSTTEKLTTKCGGERANELAVIADTYFNKDEKLTPFQESVWSGGLVIDPNTIEKQYLQPTDVNDSPTISPVFNHSNTEWENRMRMLGDTWLEPDCECADMGFERQQYLKDGFMTYPGRIGREHIDKNWKEKKPLQWAGSLIGGALATVNDVFEFGVARPVTSLGGAVLGTGSRILGNKNDGFKNGWENGNKFGAFVMDGIPGGVSKNTFDAYLLQGKFKEALKVPYCMEDTRSKRNIKLLEIIASNFLSVNEIFKNNGHGHDHGSGGFERVGGEVGTGAGRGGGVIK